MLPLPTIATRLATAPATSFPRTLEKLDIICRDESANVSVVAAIAGTDPLLTALIIGHASAGKPIANLEAAIMKLGMDGVRGLFQGARPIGEGQRRAIAANWGLANATMTMAPIVAAGVVRFLKSELNADQLALAALLHDLGSAMAILHFPEEHQQAAARCELGEGDYTTCLRKSLGVAPHDLGLILARTWHLPATILPAMRWYDQPTASAHDDLPFDDQVAVIHLARQLVRAVGFVSDGNIYLPALDQAVLSNWSLTTPVLEGWLNDFYTSMEELELYESVLAR